MHSVLIFSFFLLQAHEVENNMGPVQEDEGPNAVSQLAKRVCELWTDSWDVIHF